MVVNSNADALYIIEMHISPRRDSNSHVASIQITLTLRHRAILTPKRCEYQTPICIINAFLVVIANLICIQRCIFL